MSVKIQVRRGTEAEWTAANPTLGEGELGYDTTNDILKVGDGSTAWSGLPDADNQSAAQVTYNQTGQTYALGSTVQAAIYAIDDELIAQDIRLDTIEADENTVGSIAKALKDAKDYADSVASSQDAADEISYDDTGQTYAQGANVQAALYAVDDELLAQDGRLNTIEGDDQTSGSIAKALKDAKDYADGVAAAQDAASEISYDQSGQTYALGADVQAAIYAIDDELIAQDGRLDVIQGDINTDGSINKALKTALDYTDTEIALAKLALGTSYSVADLTARDALADLTVGDLIFVTDDGDGKWAQYKVAAITDGAGSTSTYEKIMDEDVYLNAISASAVKTAYESNADTNAFTDTLLSKLNNIEDGSTADQSAAEVPFNNTASGLTATNVKDAIDEVDGRLDTIEGDENTSGSIAKALKDAKDYADQQDALQDGADEIVYNGATSGLTAINVQDAIDELDGDVDSHIGDATIHFTQASISITESQISDFGSYEPADATILKDADIGVNVQAYDADTVKYDDAAPAFDNKITQATNTVLDAGDIGSSVQAYDANTLKSSDIGSTVQGYDANTVIDANYETFDSSETYANLRAQATTAADVGLENVTNESKATMFTDPTFTGTVTIGAGASLTGVPDPTSTTDAANKRYVDELVEGLKTAPAVHAATTGNLSGTYDNGTAGVGATLNLGVAATLTIDGESIWVLYDGVLLKDQTNKAENGRYFVSQVGDGSTDWILTRCPVCDEADEIPGRYVFVNDGVINGGTGWVQVVDDPQTFVVGTDDIDVYQFSGAGTYTAGTGLTLTGTEFSLSGDSFDADGTFASLRAQATTKEDVGLNSVTNDAQVKKLASSTDGNIPAWDGITGDALTDGYGVQTTLSSSTSDLVRADAIVTALLDKADKLATVDSSKTAGFSLGLADANKVFAMQNSTAATITVPDDNGAAFPIGTQIAFIRNGAGTVTFGGSGTILSDASKKSIKAQYTAAALLKVAADTWQLVGNLAT